uniref:G-protein coupled receptors family 1 profile domain-containing protein n=1 Tax=Biomphalaria glabrata TaxID=6526 RepID=A0A2C9KJT3_BIOGL
MVIKNILSVSPFHHLHREAQFTMAFDLNSTLAFSRFKNASLSDDPEEILPDSVKYVRGACLVVISVLGASFNTFMIIAIVPNRRLRTVRNILLVHLGGVGLLSSVFTTLYPAISMFHGEWVGGTPMCQAYAYVTSVFTSVSVWTIAALSWDKYQTIASPLHHSLTATLQKMLPCFAVFWGCGLVLSLPPLFGANEYALHKPMAICGVKFSSTDGRWYTCVLLCLSFIFPFCLMIYCYAHIFRIARTQSSRIAATMLRMVSVIQAPIAPTTQSSLSLRGTKAMGTILQLIGSFVLTYLPYSIIIIYEVIFAVKANTFFVSIATTLFQAAPFIHAAIYGIRNQILRTSFYRYARRKFQHCCAKDKRRGSVKSLNRKSPSNMKMPMRCLVRADGKQYVLRRTLSYQGDPPADGAGELTSTGFPRPHSFNVLRKANGCSPQLSNGLALHNGNSLKDEGKQVKEVSFSEKDEVSYIHPDGMSRVAREEVSYYSRDIMKEMSAMDWEADEVSKYDRADHDDGEPHAKKSFSSAKENGPDNRKDEMSRLYKFKDDITKLAQSRVKKKFTPGKEKMKKSRCRYDQEESSIFHVNEDSNYDVDSDDGVSCA